MISRLDDTPLFGRQLLQPLDLVREGFLPPHILGRHPGATAAAQRCRVRLRVNAVRLICKASSVAAGSFPATA